MSRHSSPSLLSGRPLALVMCLILVSCGGPLVTPSPASGTAETAAPATSSPAIVESLPACEPPDGTNVVPPRTAWWRDRIFYEVFVRSFADSDGDGIGDLRGLTERLDYLNDGRPESTGDLGVTGIWLMPVAESPSYHGYDVVDYEQIEADYGTAEDFKALMAAAKERGIAVIVDLVLNHTSIDHPWFQDSRTPGSEHDEWYIWEDPAPPVAGPGGRPVWHEDGDRAYYGYFWEGMPDLNVANPDVTAALDEVARFWLEDMGVDGFRLDAARHLIEDGAQLENTPATFDWLAGFRTRVEGVKPDALVLGEVWDATSTAARYVDEGALDVALEFGLADAILGSVRLGDADTLANVQAEVLDAYPPGGYAAFLTNHDQNRAMDELGRDRDAAALAATLLLTNPGIPFLYYGEELGLRGRKPDEEIRTPFPWNATPPGYGFTTGEPWEPFAPEAETITVDGQNGDPGSLLSHYRSLTRLRATHSALRTGELTPVEAEPNGVYAFLRHDATDVIAVVANLSDEPVEDISLTLAAGPLCGRTSARTLLGTSDARAPEVNAAGGFDDYRPVNHLDAHEAMVVRLSP